MKPIFYICGSDGVGKSSLAEKLKLRNKYIILDSIITNVPTFPDKIGNIRKMFVDICFDITLQTKRPVVFYGNSYADSYQSISKEKLDMIYFITLVCDEPVLRSRVYETWGGAADKRVAGADMTWLGMSITRNDYFRKYYDEHQFANMFLIDTTKMTKEQVAIVVDDYIEKYSSL